MKEIARGAMIRSPHSDNLSINLFVEIRREPRIRASTARRI